MPRQSRSPSKAQRLIRTTHLAAISAAILQKAQFAKRASATQPRAAPKQNTNPIGTGPYKVKEFRANDTVVFDINENYRDPNKPHFSEVTFKGAEDASASARAVLETGEADYAWNLQVEPGRANDMAAKGNGVVVSAFAGNVERILINFTNPDPTLGDKRSDWTAEDPNPHPFLSDPAVRQALSHGHRSQHHRRAALRRRRRAHLQRPLRPAGLWFPPPMTAA